MMVECVYDNGSSKVCVFMPMTSCTFVYSSVAPAVSNRGISGEVDQGGALDGGGVGGRLSGEAAAQR